MIDREFLDKAATAAINEIFPAWLNEDIEAEDALGAAAVRAILTALDTAGYCIVPKEATDEMLDAGWDANLQFDALFNDIWQAMVAKAQEPQS